MCCIVEKKEHIVGVQRRLLYQKFSCTCTRKTMKSAMLKNATKVMGKRLSTIRMLVTINTKRSQNDNLCAKYGHNVGNVTTKMVNGF